MGLRNTILKHIGRFSMRKKTRKQSTKKSAGSIVVDYTVTLATGAEVTRQDPLEKNMKIT